ncbi:MAG TPA: presqualene diphosphate synthase HpnD [Nitrospiria bacterium]|nr:presqualene diphosphate synthase HpnD [Nitrospiria bacterium]
MSLSSAAITRRSKTNFYFAFLFLPKAQREALYAVYAFARQVDDTVDLAVSPLAAEEAIAGWRAELDRVYSGSPEHPVARQLSAAVTRYRLPREHFDALIDGVEMDLTRRRYETFEQLARYCYRVASVVGLICIEIFGYRNPATRDYAIAQGMAFQLTNILRDIKIDAAKGRIYLPMDELARFGYGEAELLAHQYNEAFVALMAFQCERARAYYDKAAGLLPAVDRRTMLPSEIMGGIYRRILDDIEARRYNVFDEECRLSAPTKLLIALRVWASGLLRR